MDTEIALHAMAHTALQSVSSIPSDFPLYSARCGPDTWQVCYTPDDAQCHSVLVSAFDHETELALYHEAELHMLKASAAHIATKLKGALAALAC